MNPFHHPEFDDHEHISFFSDPGAGLHAIVAIHNTAPLGIAGGGCRMQPYGSADEALTDVLRLSKAMSYKLALARIPSGGAKSVVIADPKTGKTSALLRALGRAVDRLGGKYVIAEDVGTTSADMKIIGEETSFVVGQQADTTPPTAYGVFLGLQRGVERKLERDLDDVHVAVQGVGGVGRHLTRFLVEAGAQVTVADVDRDAVDAVVRELGVSQVAPGAIYDVPADVFAPCALGAILDESTIARLKVAMVAGGANNQLAEPRHGQMLAERDILYLPDFVLNMGGVLGAASAGMSLDDDVDPSSPEALSDCDRVVDVLDEAFARAKEDGTTVALAAEALAKDAIAERRR